VRIKGSRLAPIGLLDADGDLTAEVGQPSLVVTVLEELQGSVDYLVLGGELAALHKGADELFPLL